MTLRTEARGWGQLYYWTGQPCAHGHMSKRYVSNGMCAECHRLQRTRTDALTVGRPLGAYGPYYATERVEQMKEMRASGMTLRGIGQRFGISRQAVSQQLDPEEPRRRAREWYRRRAIR